MRPVPLTQMSHRGTRNRNRIQAVDMHVGRAQANALNPEYFMKSVTSHKSLLAKVVLKITQFAYFCSGTKGNVSGAV